MHFAGAAYLKRFLRSQQTPPLRFADPKSTPWWNFIHHRFEEARRSLLARSKSLLPEMFQAVPVEKPRLLRRALQEDEIDRGRQRRGTSSEDQRLAFGSKRPPKEESSLIQGPGFDGAGDELWQNR